MQRAGFSTIHCRAIAILLAMSTLNACSRTKTTNAPQPASGSTNNGTAATPTSSLTAGLYHSTKSATLRSTTSGATVHYTTDGSTPTCSSSTGVVSVAATMTVKAITCKTGYSNSAVASFSYTVNVITPVAVEAFPSTTGFPTITWTPKVKFSIASSDSVALYSDTNGTILKASASATAGSNIVTLNSESTLGVTTNVYAKTPSANEYITLGSYTTKKPLSFNGSNNGFDGSIYAIAFDSSGNVYVGGDFANAPGGVPASRIAKWNGTSWSALGSGANNLVRALAVDGSGALYAGGTFTSAGGNSASYIAKWDGASWSALGTGMNGMVHTLVFNSTGTLYAGGDFSTAGGTSANGVAKWTNNSWSSLGTGTNGQVRSLAFDGSANLYAGGDFDTAGGISANNVAIWNENSSSWTGLGTGYVDGESSPGRFNIAIATDKSGNVYCVFNDHDSNSFSRFATWDGTNWTSLIYSDERNINKLIFDSNENLYLGGASWALGGVAKWNGAGYATIGSGTDNDVSALAVDSMGNIYIGGVFSTVDSLGRPYFAKWSPAFNLWF